MMKNLGALRVDELIAPITSMRLTREGVVFTAVFSNVSKPARGPVRVFTAGGEPVTEHAHLKPSIVEIPATSEGDCVHFTYTLHFQTASMNAYNDELRTRIT
jgi:hypothetical protein